MALSKKVKNGGVYYKGDVLAIKATPGKYTLAIIPLGTNAVVNSITITPSSSGNGDTFTLQHVDTIKTFGGTVIKTLIDGVSNHGKGKSLHFDFATLEIIKEFESLRLIYNKVSNEAMSVYTITDVLT